MIAIAVDRGSCTFNCPCCWKQMSEKPVATDNRIWDKEVMRRANRLCEIVCYGVTTPKLSGKEQELLRNHCGFSIWKDMISN